MMSIHMISNDEMLKLTKGQGHKVKGQGQICKWVKNALTKCHQPTLLYTVKGRQHVLKINDLWSQFLRLLPFIKEVAGQVKYQVWKILFFGEQPFFRDRSRGQGSRSKMQLDANKKLSGV